MKPPMNCRSIVTVIILVLMLNAGAAMASTVTLGGFTFDTTAFPTSASLVSGGPASFNFPTTGTVDSDLLTAVNSDLTSFLFGTPINFLVTFGNGPLQNLPGADFVIFELGGVDDVSVKLDGTTISYLTAFTGFSAAGTLLNAIAIDLSDFGIAANGLVSVLEIGNASGHTLSASINAIGGLNIASSSVPEPATFLSLVGGLALLSTFKRLRARG